MEKIRSKDGTLIAYEKSGHGPGLVLVHGTSADHNRWAPILNQLQEKFSVYTVDRRGRGESGDNLPYSIEKEFEDIAAVTESIPESVYLLGHSYGALCSVEAALLSENIKRLILYEPPIGIKAGADYAPQVVTEIQQKLKEGDREGVVETFLREIPKVPPHELELLKTSPSWKERIASAHTIPRELQASGNEYHFEPGRFTGLSTPTLLLLGGDSPRFIKDATSKLHETLLNNRVAVMPGQQHVAMNTAPEMFLKEVIGFLEKTG
jgi:pimeloyl-ACP methyl ester carboxylesterase